MEPFKNWLGFEHARKIATAIERAVKQFSVTNFLRNLREELEPLELKGRRDLIMDRLIEQIEPHPKSFPNLVRALKTDESDLVGLDGFLVWPLTQFVAEHGVDDFDRSMSALKEMTKVFTAEFAVRPFFLRDESYMLDLFLRWTQDENEHVRRLVSEGSRPFLPWGLKLPRFSERPELTWPLLLALKNDSSKYVQKSVSIHINDLSKKYGDWLVAQLKGWPNPWVARHAVRTLAKEGHRGALRILGVGPARPKIEKPRLTTKSVKLGQSLNGSVFLTNTSKIQMTVLVDVEISLLRANGQYRAKVFKGKKVVLQPGDKKQVQINTPLKKVTTRNYYPGPQYWKLVVNGHLAEKQRFVLRLK